MNEHPSRTTSTGGTGEDLREELRFRSGDAACAATLHRPRTPTGGNVPCVVLAAGVGQTRADGFTRLAERFAEAGFAAMTFDFRHLGDSEGQPRQLVDFERQREDLLAAIAFARALGGVDPDRIAVWGFSFGGGHAVHVAARDPQLAAAIVLCPFVDGRAFTFDGDIRNNARLMGAAVRAASGRRPIRMPLTGPSGTLRLFTQPEAGPGFAAVRGEGSLWRNEILARPSQPAARIRPVRDARRVRCPLLVGLGTRDTMVPARPIELTAERAPRGELHRYPIGHFGGFLDGSAEVVDDHIAFLTRHLMPQSPTGAVPA